MPETVSRHTPHPAEAAKLLGVSRQYVDLLIGNGVRLKVEVNAFERSPARPLVHVHLRGLKVPTVMQPKVTEPDLLTRWRHFGLHQTARRK